MPFSFYAPPQLTFDQTNPELAGAARAQDLISNALKQQQLATQAKYAPRMAEADIFSKMFSPLAQFSISPLALGLAPEQRNQVLGYISKLLGNSGVGGNPLMGNGAPSQQQGNGGSIGGVGGYTPIQQSSLGDQSSPSYQGTQGNPPNNPNLPPNNISQGFGQRAVAPAQEQLHSPGTTYRTSSGGEMQTPSQQTIGSYQPRLNVLDTFSSLAPDLIKESKEFLQPGSNVNRWRSSIASELQRIGAPSSITSKISNDIDMAGRYHKLQSDIANNTGLLKQIFPEPNTQGTFERYAQQLQIQPDDTEKTYRDRVNKITDELNNRVKPLIKKALGSTGGFDLGDELSKSEDKNTDMTNSVKNSMKQNNYSGAEKALANSSKWPSFKSKKEFTDWFWNQDPVVRNAYRYHKLSKQGA